MSSTGYEPVIGLEVHAQLLTRSKAFCSCPAESGREPNAGVCPICLALPGTLPVPSSAIVEFTLRLGLATGCRINPRSVFARKNYFYPDLPKGYQISQFDQPLCTGGSIDIDLEEGGVKRVGITRVHMEEDAGKSIHDLEAGTLVDINRSGVPLVEIVSEPDIRSPREAFHYLKSIRQLVTYLGICDGNMEEGSLRCDANVSVRKRGEREFGTKTEVKNMNSFRNVERALEFEIRRQTRVLEEGGRVEQETLLWDANQNIAVPMRSKERAHDYRYFPDPDLVPVVVSDAWLGEVRSSIPETPRARRERFQHDYGLSPYDAGVLTAEKEYADYFEKAASFVPTGKGGTGTTTGDGHAASAKSAANWVMTEVLRLVADRKSGKTLLADFPVTPSNLGALIGLIQDGTISSRTAKEVFEKMVETGDAPSRIVESLGLTQISDEEGLRSVAREIVAKNRPQVEKFRAGNTKVMGFFVGEVMKATRGKANPELINAILIEELGKHR